MLNCKDGQAKVEFARQLSFFHGEMGTGKSSVASLLDHCLGGKLERTPALRSELLSVQMQVTIDDTHALFERVMTDPWNVRVSWRTGSGPAQSESLPVKASKNPIIGDDIFGLSDLILRFIGIPVMRVRKRSYDPESDLVRLSFRDLAEFVYLNQGDLDSDFFLLGVPIRMEKSKDALHFFVGYMSERLNDLLQKLQDVRSSQRSKREAAGQIEAFLRQFEFESVDRLNEEIMKLESDIEKGEAGLNAIRNGISPVRTVAEEERTAIKQASERVAALAGAISDTEMRILEQEELIAELVSMKFKLGRASAATALLEGVNFENCPACGSEVQSPTQVGNGGCYLCKQPVAPKDVGSTAEIYRQDIDERIDDLKQSVQRHKRALQRSASRLDIARHEMNGLERQIADRVHSYESEFLARSRSLERRIAAARERISFLERVKEMPAAVGRILKDADELSSEIEGIKRSISEEEAQLTTAESNFKCIEDNYHEILLSIGFPGVSPEDVVVVNRKNLIPEIWIKGDEPKKWTFFDAGSGGKKTLLKICFALALHKTAAERGLPVPRLLIIDSPMKNITPDVNPAIFERFYKELYSLLEGPLKDWQCVVIDQTYFAPEPGKLISTSRLMKQSDPEYPPLIPYYTGP
jgi:prefoldin subunit 5